MKNMFGIDFMFNPFRIRFILLFGIHRALPFVNIFLPVGDKPNKMYINELNKILNGKYYE